MKKKNIKPLIMSSLAALSLGSMSVAGTFALFTDQAETTVNIGAGKVKVGSSLSGVTLYSADATYTTGDVAGVITGDFAGTYYYKQQDGSFANGGTASVSGSTLSIERMSPGDKVVTSLGFVNDSNVNIKYRLKVTTAHEHGDELLKNLELKVFGNKYHGLKSLQTKWTEIDAGAAISGSGIEVVLPLETGNEAQAKDAEIKFTLEAVQANAEVTDADKAEYYADAVSTTEYLAPEEITTENNEKKTAVDKVIEVPLSAEATEEKTVKVSIPAGAQLEDDASSLKLYVENMGEDPTYQGIAIQVDQGAEIYEVTLDGLKDDNQQPITVTVDLGYEPIAVYHVHGNPPYATIPFTYNSGLTTFTTTNFSEFTFVRDTDIIEIPNLAKLEIVRNYVNSGHSLAGKTVKLLTDLDLNNQEWTPIGTIDHPFSGVFDGDNHTIKNYKICGAGEKVGLALFGCIKGNASTLTSVTSLSDFYNATNYTVNLPAEDIFTCVVKNLNVSGADVNTTADGWTAAVVAYAEDATISNIHLSNSVLKANEKVGGIVGFLPDHYACYITNCDTSSNVTVTTSTGNHSAGILGRVNSASSRGIIANCTNNATINCAGVNGGGIAGQAKNVLYYNNTNNGSVTGKTRAAGIATDCSGSVFIDCTNNGYIKTTAVYSGGSDSSAGIASYLSGDGISVIVNCHNGGTVEGNAPADNTRIAGIVADGVNANDKIINNSNTGTLINHAENGKIYDICNLSNVANEVTPSNLSGLNSETASDNKYIKVNSSLALSENDNTVTFNGQEKLEFVNSPSYLTLDLSGANKSSFVLMVNDTVVTLKNGDDNNVTISGKGNTVKVDQSETVNSLTVLNDDTQSASSFNILGTATNLVLKGNGLVNGEIAENATAERVAFSDNGTFTLTNRGTISHTTSGIYGNEHTIDTLASCNITIHNYGTIEAKVNSADVASYALLFYGGATVNLYAYNGSHIVAEGHSAIVTSGGTQVNVYYQDGAEVTSYGSQSTYPSAFGFYCTVAKMN